MVGASYRKPFRNPKLQTANTNEVAITKNQNAKSGMKDWDLEFPWGLGIGIWCFTHHAAFSFSSAPASFALKVTKTSSSDGPISWISV